jgi:hypothetical protein
VDLLVWRLTSSLRLLQAGERREGGGGLLATYRHS